MLYYEKVYTYLKNDFKEAIPLKYWRGWVVAAVFAFFTWGISEFAKTHEALVDMVWPYITRSYQSYMAEWSAGAAACLWQVFAVLIVVLIVAAIVLMIVLRWNLIQVAGWVAAAASILFFVHTGIYGLNTYAGSIAADIRMPEEEYTLAELEEAAVYYRDKANELAPQASRTGGQVDFPEFETLAEQAANGFENLVYEQYYSIFAGSTVPVKKLGWADMYTSMGITGFTFGITGEAAVNPQIPDLCLAFTMCHEMAHRMSIATERDANFAAFLACRFNDDVNFRYSAYFMAYRYCYNSIVSVGAKDTAARVSAGVSDLLKKDMAQYDAFFQAHRDEKATKIADTANDTVIKASGDESGIKSYGEVTDLLVSWHIQQVVIPSQTEEEQQFDPFDPSQVDLTGLPNVK